MSVSCSTSHFMSLFTTGLILLNLISTFLHHPMKRNVIGLVLLTTKVTVSPGGSSLRILTRLSFVLAFAVLSKLQQTSILHHLQGREPHLLFPFLILNNLKILCHLTLLMHQPPILSNLSKVSLVKMKIIQSPWPTLTFPIFLADPSFYHLRIMGSATWQDSLFKFRDIVAHQGPNESTDPNHKGSKYNVMVEWESGEVTYEPLTLISKDDQITCAVYTKKHDLLDTTGWKHLKRYAKTSKRLIRAVKQSRIRQVRASARYQHGFQVPKDYNDAIRLDKGNSNTHWQDAMDLELTQIHEYKVFKYTGKAQFHNGKAVTSDGFQKIRVHFVYAVKHDGRFKA